ncbi:MAG: TIGR02588 family protein [Shinella sp.]|jgi:uncharacterized protein (TIGR02588 family)|nr:TIGR02588 family protein [Shinella sp.]
MTTTRNRIHTERHDPHWIEWLTGILSAAVVVSLIGWIGYEAVIRDGKPPELSVTMLGAERTTSGFRVDFEISNSAPTTAAGVNVTGALVQNGEVVEESTVTLDYVPAESQAAGAVIFSIDPAGKQIRLQAKGYGDP